MYACVGVQILLATKKHEAPPVFKMLALNHRHRDVAFGWFSPDLDPEVAQQLPPPKLPYLMAAFVDPTLIEDADGRVPLSLEGFDAALKYTYMSTFVDAVASRWGAKDEKVCLPP